MAGFSQIYVDVLIIKMHTFQLLSIESLIDIKCNTPSFWGVFFIIHNVLKVIEVNKKFKNMKKLMVLFVLALLVSVQSKACHIDSLGWCRQQAYFDTKQFNNHSIFQFRYYGDTVILFTYITKASGSTDTIFSLPQAKQNVGIRVEFRYKDIDSTSFRDWQWGSWSGVNEFAGCSSLGVNFANINATKSGNNLIVAFSNAEDETGIDHYNIKLSSDTKTWDTVKVIKPTGQHNYSISIDLSLIFAFILPFIGLITNKRNQIRNFLILFIVSGIVLLSCKKEAVANQVYKFVKIEAVNQDNGIITSKIKSF